MDTISSSVVSGTLKRLWLCIDFAVVIDISIDAALLEPTTFDDTRVDTLLTSSSARAVSSTYSKARIVTRGGEKYPPPVNEGLLSSLASYFQNQPAQLAGKIFDLWWSSKC